MKPFTLRRKYKLCGCKLLLFTGVNCSFETVVVIVKNKDFTCENHWECMCSVQDKSCKAVSTWFYDLRVFYWLAEFKVVPYNPHHVCFYFVNNTTIIFSQLCMWYCKNWCFYIPQDVLWKMCFKGFLCVLVSPPKDSENLPKE